MKDSHKGQNKQDEPIESREHGPEENQESVNKQNPNPNSNQGQDLSGLSFEEALERLEKLVRDLEDGKLSLEESLEYFQEGIKLSQACRELLASAEYKVHHLLKDVEAEEDPALEPGESDNSAYTVDE